MNEALAKAKVWQDTYCDNYFLELQRIEHYDCNDLVHESLQIAHELNIPVVATHPVQFLDPEDFLAHEVRVCVADGEMLDDGNRKVKYGEDQYFKSAQEMSLLFADIPSAITNSLEIAKKCNLEITLGTYFLPDYQTPNGTPLEEYLTILAHQGLDMRMLELFPDDTLRSTNESTYRKRLELEIETIIQMGFPGYFLIVADFINWAKENGVPVGPGRGSGAGSLVAFSLGITDIDPLRYSLLFERFLNPERVSMPDFDIDFCQEKRELVIRYVQDKYGADAVSQIATFGTMSSKAVIKDVGRVLGLPYGLCDSISKLIMNTPAKSWGLEDAYQEFPDLKLRIDNADDEVRRLWEMSLQLEDLTRSVGKHAAGVLIAPSQLSDFCPLYLADGMQTSQLDKDDVETIGLVKFDFLGLRNLTIIQEAVENIECLHGVKLKLSNSEFEDPKVYELLQEGNTTAVFQLESQGMKRLLVKLEPSRFEDIIAVLALYRPGPLGSGMVDDFVKRKKGEQDIDYFHDDLREVLDPTYGVIVYQEQVMQISQIIGGYTLGGADLLRRAMGKKKKEEMDKHRAIFTEGAIKKNYDPALAEKLFDLMAMFAEYGFNKSHTAAYAVVSYHTAYLKAHYPACFMAATLSSELDKTDKLYEFYQDCLANNLTILPPNINLSEYRFKALDKDTICYALGAVKGVGQNVVDVIVAERDKNGFFTSLIDFCRRVDKKVINKRTLESLIKAGCFDVLDTNRAKLLGNLPKVIEFIEQERQNENQASLFDVFASDDGHNFVTQDMTLEELPEFTLKSKLTNEKQAIGYYLTASLFDEYAEITRKLEILPLSKFNTEDEDIQEIINSRYTKQKQKALIGGIINYMGSRPTKKGGKIAFIRIEDASGELEFVVFNEVFERYSQLLKIDELVFVEGEVIYDSFRDEIKVTAERILTLDEVLLDKIHTLEINLVGTDAWNQLRPMIASTETGANLIINYRNSVAKCQLRLSELFKFQLNFERFEHLSLIVGKTGWRLGLNRL
ncbi:MAG: DNA polymerase III subunit alpha [Proteobacteria bacterium]|nr:MAG: DNA polymerase III subunit alpha [Pseudomonadota bacterium]